jgi:hypothetical protein
VGDALDARGSRVTPEWSELYATCVFISIRTSDKLASEGFSHIEALKMSFLESYVFNHGIVRSRETSVSCLLLSFPSSHPFPFQIFLLDYR